MAEIVQLPEIQEENEAPKKLLDLTHQEARAFFLKHVNLKKVVNSANLVDREQLSEAEPVVDSLEFDLFPQVSG